LSYRPTVSVGNGVPQLPTSLASLREARRGASFRKFASLSNES